MKMLLRKPAPVRLLLCVFIVPILFVQTGCISPRKIDKWVDKHYKVAPPAPKQSDYISVIASKENGETKPSHTVKGKRKFLPLLFYYQWDLNTVTTLHPKATINQFSTALLSYAHAKGLRKKLNGQKLELTIGQVPAAFTLRDKGFLVYVVAAYFGQEEIYIEPEQRDLVVAYRLLQGAEEVAGGTVTIGDRNRPVGLKALQGGKRMMHNYLEQYDANIRACGREVVDQIMRDLKTKMLVAQH